MGLGAAVTGRWKGTKGWVPGRRTSSDSCSLDGESLTGAGCVSG